jgi:hypothetical protein
MSAPVKRYDVDGNGDYYEYELGPYVLYADHDAAVAEMRPYMTHKPRCQTNNTLPMESGRIYTHPDDRNRWRNTLVCDCGLDALLVGREG